MKTSKHKSNFINGFYSAGHGDYRRSVPAKLNPDTLKVSFDSRNAPAYSVFESPAKLTTWNGYYGECVEGKPEMGCFEKGEVGR